MPPPPRVLELVLPETVLLTIYRVPPLRQRMPARALAVLPEMVLPEMVTVAFAWTARPPPPYSPAVLPVTTTLVSVRTSSTVRMPPPWLGTGVGPPLEPLPPVTVRPARVTPMTADGLSTLNTRVTPP